MSNAQGRAAFQYRDFPRFLAVRFLSMIAAQAQGVAIGWQIYDITHQALDLGYVGLAQFLPAAGLTLFAGHAADRYDRRLILGLSFAVQALCAGLLLALARGQVGQVGPIYAVLVLSGAARAFAGPAGQSFLPHIVAKVHFPNAVSWSSSAWQFATIIGPAVGGALYALGAAVVYGCVLAALVAATVLVRSMTTKAAAAGAGSGGTWERLIAGITYVRAKPLILGAISLDLFAVLFGGATALLPVYASDILFVGPTGLGFLRSAPAVGAAAMGVWLAHHPLNRKAGRSMFACVALFGVATVVFGVSTSFWLSLAALVVLGAADMVSVYVRQTLVQIATPDDKRGRVSAVNMVFIGASNELGEFESGLTAAWLGAVPAVVVGGLGTLGVVGLWAWLFPGLRKIDRIDNVG